MGPLKGSKIQTISTKAKFSCCLTISCHPHPRPHIADLGRIYSVGYAPRPKPDILVVCISPIYLNFLSGCCLRDV